MSEIKDGDTIDFTKGDPYHRRLKIICLGNDVLWMIVDNRGGNLQAAFCDKNMRRIAALEVASRAEIKK